jgi:hypothetical protein
MKEDIRVFFIYQLNFVERINEDDLSLTDEDEIALI